ncbi:hypothetical protein [Solidesulfovibrio carbinolicus]|uniref:hypothetical protein n=1 Tax=Solidesulfovibrio carbinolicus TaxID=296842 RepID=UPI0010112D70|nr:hypothetical protein [Solidesulfovibrio carbinolicus]
MIKEKTKRLQMLEERLENKVKAAKKAADELEVIEQRAQNRAKQREKRQSDKDRYTLGLVLKFLFKAVFNAGSKERMDSGGFSERKTRKIHRMS